MLVPFKNDDGKFSYVDFSHLNAYDTLTRPIQTVLNAVNLVEQIKMVSWMILYLGLIESTKELDNHLYQNLSGQKLTGYCRYLVEVVEQADGREITMESWIDTDWR